MLLHLFSGESCFQMHACKSVHGSPAASVRAFQLTASSSSPVPHEEHPLSCAGNAAQALGLLLASLQLTQEPCLPSMSCWNDLHSARLLTSAAYCSHCVTSGMHCGRYLIILEAMSCAAG